MSFISLLSISPLTIVVVVLCVVALIDAYARNSKRLPLPPGPRGLPYIGFSNVPRKRNWLAYIELGKKYGDLIHYTRFGQRYLIVNSLEAADSILQKNARFTSDRPTFSALDQISGWGRLLVMTRYSEEWREDRKMFHQNFRPEVVSQFHPAQIQGVNKFISKLRTSKEPLMDQISTFAHQAIFSAVYGLEIETNKDDMAKNGQEVVERTETPLIPGCDAYKYIPFIHLLPSWFPGGHIKVAHQTLRGVFEEVFERPWNLMMEAMKVNENHSSLLATMISEMSSDAPKEELIKIKEMGGQAVVAGADTSTSTIATFFMAMSLYPEVQAKAQQELDSVLGPGKLPTYEDRESLPYIEGIFREVFRWHPVLPMGIPHVTSEDIFYEEYCIPKKTIIFPNIWAMLHDPTTMESPEKFIPERHLRSDGKAESNLNTILAFGFGRRICAGRWMANDLVWLVITSVLATMNISTMPNKNQEDYFRDGAFCLPKALDFTVSPRS
ncbi:cytochrome P450 [Dendrothele bispora CBS 962.96]|uniref:Cytochrome P450 n=1 Tax=Dendrothele bispora (strain CBS 962.96) TaxID=1314807 RepID=A0A4V4HER3_DENBC|nr:cytochrome P450 [Dendrothele bispora CBS 962.96]